MPEAKRKKGISRREFIAGTVGGVVVGAVVGAAAGSLGFPKTVSQSLTQTMTQTQTQTQTVTGPTTTTTSTTTVTSLVPPGFSQDITLNVNGVNRTTNVDNRWSLADTLRYKFDMIGTKVGCDRGECGSCAVMVDGVAILSCTKLAVAAAGHTITTIEGIGMPEKLSPIQAALCDSDAIQCGACVPGIVVAATAYLKQNPKPTDADWRAALGGNICRCSIYPHLLAGLEAVA